MTKRIQMIKGPIDVDWLGMMLLHEHLFTDLRGPHVPGYAQGEASAVIEVVGSYLDDAAESGVTALVKDFIPALLQRGVSQKQIRQITVNNPANAFAF